MAWPGCLEGSTGRPPSDVALCAEQRKLHCSLVCNTMNPGTHIPFPCSFRTVNAASLCEAEALEPLAEESDGTVVVPTAMHSSPEIRVILVTFHNLWPCLR